MSDSDSPELPQEDIDKNGGKPQNTPFSWYHPPEGQPKKLNEGDDETQEENPISEQEQLFKAAAIKCAQMEEGLAILMDKANPNDLGGGVHLLKFENTDATTLLSYVESFLGVEGGQLKGKANIHFSDGIANFAKELKIPTNRELHIGGINTDIATRKEFEEYAKRDPMITSNTGTYYYFTSEGEYRKVCDIPEVINVDPTRKLMFHGATIKRYESQMHAEDFEIAGQALVMLKKRVENPNWDKKTPTAP